MRSSEQIDRAVDRVPLVLTYHPFKTQIKQFLLQNFRILSTYQQSKTRDIFPQPPFVAYKRDLNLRNMLVHSTDHSCTEQCGSRSCQRPRCHTSARMLVPRPRYEVLNAIFPSVTISPASPVTLCTAYPVTDALRFFILVKPDAASGVVLANTYEEHIRIHTSFIYPRNA